MKPRRKKTRIVRRCKFKADGGECGKRFIDYNICQRKYCREHQEVMRVIRRNQFNARRREDNMSLFAFGN